MTCNPTPAGYIGFLAAASGRFWFCGDELATRKYRITIHDPDTWPEDFTEFLYANGEWPNATTGARQ